MQRLVPSLIRRATEMFGGSLELAAYLQVADHSLRLWAAGKASAPTNVVEMLVDIVLKDDVARAMQDRRHEPRRTNGGTQGSSTPPASGP